MYKQKGHRSHTHTKPRHFRGHNPRNNGKFRQKFFDPTSVILSVPETHAAHEITNTFSDFAIDSRLKETIKARGFDSPTPIQDQSIPAILDGRDVVGISNTGTGKTGAFLLPLINKVIKGDRERVLVIAPTRELAVQIEKEFHEFSRGLKIKSALCIGGVSIKPQIDRLSFRPAFVVGTPGRLLDLADQKKLFFADFSSIVLDEVDRMLDMGFIHDIKKIISKLPRHRQSLFFSATLEDSVKSVMKEFITDPVLITVKKADISPNIEQNIVHLEGREKIDVLREVLDTKEVTKALVFVRTKRNADKVFRTLSKGKFQAVVMHGNKSQNQRQNSLEQFRRGQANILIATDVAARGIDVDDVSHVINYELPESYEDYIHRIGRTGRADKKGIALTFI